MAHHLILGHSDVLAMWAARRIPHVGEAGFGPCQAIGVASGPGDDDKLLAVVVFHNFVYRTLECTVAAASPRWATRGTIQALFQYAFVQCDARKLFTVTPHRNKRALKFNIGLGYKPEATIRHHFGNGEHAVVCGIMRWEWERGRWYVPPMKAAA